MSDWQSNRQRSGKDWNWKQNGRDWKPRKKRNNDYRNKMTSYSQLLTYQLCFIDGSSLFTIAGF